MQKCLIKLIAVTLFVCMIMTVGCSQNQNKSLHGTSESATLESTIESGLSETTTTTEPKPIEFEDRIDETVVAKNIIFSADEMETFDHGGPGLALYGSYYLGFGNPLLKTMIQEYFSDDTLEVQDFPKLHFAFGGYDEFFDRNFTYALNYFDIDYVRYVLEENGLRLWTDEIPYEFFIEKFPDYVKQCDDGQYIELGITFNEGFVLGVLNHHNYMYISDESDFDGRYINVNYKDPSNEELLKLGAFFLLVQYNYFRDCIRIDFPKSKGGPINQGLSTDGKYVWVPTEEQYKTFQKDYATKVSGCENIDILIPETREDLKSSGVDVEKYDDMCEHLYGGAKISK